MLAVLEYSTSQVTSHAGELPYTGRSLVVPVLVALLLVGWGFLLNWIKP